MNDSIKEMKIDIDYINKAISDLLNDFAHRNNCGVELEFQKIDYPVLGGSIRIIHNVKIKAIYG